ncbi:putative odorant receptor 85d [Photinus pyralis]|uniref:putative odorant receptor 85d n=1 Tax=Photinus pyralis TaxID=7054 RepID=UPI001266F319|nr:putative odorant receptor 85d [Photinus pyralis]
MPSDHIPALVNFHMHLFASYRLRESRQRPHSSNLTQLFQIQLFSGEFWYLVIYLSAGCSLLFGDCFSTQRVINESETVGDACYQIDSVGCDLQFQKSLTMVIKEGQEPVVFTIEKFGNFSVGSIQIILKASFSYYTFLRSFS